MGKASREKWERKFQAALERVPQIKPATQSPWYETNLLWVPLTTALAIILFVVAAMMKGDLRFLLWVALALFIHPSWILIKNIGIKRLSFQKASFLVHLLLATLGTYGFYSFLAEEPIAVSPSEVKLTHLFDSQSTMRGIIDVSIYNKGDDPYYEIWTKIVINSDFLSAQTIDLDLPTIEERVGTGKDPRGIALASACLRGHDKDSLPAFLCVIDRLGPKEIFKIQLTTVKARPSNAPEDKIGTALIQTVKFSKNPGRRFRNFPGNESGAGSEFTIPEKFTSTSIIYFCPDIGEPFQSPSPITCTPNSKYQIKKR
jgi:hypothetical protein